MKTVLITGASTGFGRNAAIALASQGWRVFASMREKKMGDALSKLAGDTGRIELISIDVTDQASIAAGVTRVLNESGGTIDALLNNAGYSVLGAFEDMSDAECRQQMETNFFGALAVTRAVIPAMREARRGRIVTVTSNAVNSPHPLLTMYAASKWALEGWSEGLAMELAPFGIEVRVVQPGAHRTPFATNVVPVMPEESRYRRWFDVAMPGIGNLDQWGRDPEKATAPIVQALTDDDVPFRQAVGDDSLVFSALKAVSFEARAWLLRSICGLPAANQFVDRAPVAGAEPAVLDQVIEKIGRSLKEETPGQIDNLAAVFRGLVRSRG